MRSGRSKPEEAGLQLQPVEGAARGAGENPLGRPTGTGNPQDTGAVCGYPWTPNLYSDAPHSPAGLVNGNASQKSFKLR